MFTEAWFWIFNFSILILLMLDLCFFHRKSHVIGIKESLWMTLFWVVAALLFNLYLYFTQGAVNALNFLAGYLVEKTLSIDNLFVFLVLFSYFRLPDHLIHKVLFWGILGAILMRALFIVCGIFLIQHFHWMIYLFGAFLIFTGVKLAQGKQKEEHPEPNFLIKFLQRALPVTPDFVEDRFFVKKEGFYFATPLFLVLLAVEITDLIFAIDSIPAIIGITEDPFIVYTSNILAILGLRSLFFALSHLMRFFHYLHYGLALILIFIGCKMLLSGVVAIPIFFSLGVISFILIISVLLSIINPAES